MLRVRGTLAALALVVLAGCNTTQSDKFVATEPGVKPKRVFIAYYLDQDPRVLDNERFAERLSAGLSRCGVSSRSAVSAPPFSGFPTEYANNTTADVEAVLVVSMGDNQTARFVEAMMGGKRGETGSNYKVAMFDRKTMTKIWGTDINVRGSKLLILKPAERAENFATDLVGYLAADGIIENCPKAAS